MSSLNIGNFIRNSGGSDSETRPSIKTAENETI